MNSKRIISLILSIVMTLQIFVFQTPVHAMEGANPTIQKSEGQKTSERTEEFAFKNTKKPKLSWFSDGNQSLFGSRSVSTTKTETLKITTKATGLDDGSKQFDWAAFGQNKKFKAWIEVAYVEDKKPGEEVATQRHKVSEEFEISEEGDISTIATVDASKTVDYYFLKTEYDTDDAAFKINAVLEYAGSLSPKNKKNLEFSVDIYQIVSTKITYNLIDEYGKAIDLTDTKEEKPADTDLENLGKIGNVTTFNLKNEGEEILWQNQKLDEFDLMDSSLTMSLTKNEIKSNNIDYKLSSTYDVINGGKVTIQRQKDAVTPKDPQNPGDIPEGYARLNLSADALAGGPTGTFNKDDDKDNRRVVDVKAGKPYTSAKAEVDKVTKPFPLTSEKKVDTGKTFDKWTPELGTLGTALAKETKNLNATYKSSDKEIIPYLPTEPVPTEDENGLPIPTNFVIVTFKSEDAKKGKVKIGNKEGVEVKAKVKPGIDLSKKSEITTVPAENYGFTKWDPELTKAAADQTYTAYFVKSGDKINEGDPIPKDWFKVTVSQDEDSIKSGTVTKAVYAVKPNDKLEQDKFADVSKAANDGYKDPAWYVGSDKLDKPYEKEITTSTDFIARATEEIANKFKTNGLKAVDITAYKGDQMGPKFWNKGVTTQKEDAVLERILAEATVTDTTDPARSTKERGTFPGTLKVTFSDGSSLEVQNQKLIVIDTKIDIDYDKDSKKDANAPRHKDEVVKGKIKSDETLEGAKVEILDKDNNVIGITLAKADGSFIAGTRPLEAGETIKVRVTLPKADKESPAVEKVVGLNPDELNSILPTADKVAKNFKDKKGVDQTKVATLEEAIKEAYKLVNKAGEGQEQKDQKAKAKTPSKAEQDKLDNAYKAIKAAIKDLTENKIPEIKAPAYKEIFVGEDINLDDGVTVTDDNIKQVNGKDYSYTIYDGSNNVVEKAAMVAKDGTYRVVYKAEDTQDVKAEHTMTVVVKKTVVEVPGEFPEKTPEGYVKVEFKSGEHAGLNGVSKFLVKKDAPKSAVKEPEIIPKEGYKVAEPKWSVAIPETFANDFATEAQVLAKTTTTEPDAKDKDKYAKLTFEKGDHGEFDKSAKTTIYVLKNEEVKFNAPEIKAADGFTFAGWEPKLQETYTADQTHTAQYASNSDVSDVPVKDFQEVKFLSGTDGNFGKNGETPITEKSVWVRPGKLVDLRTKAPEVTVTTTGKSHIGWDQDLVQTFTKAETATVINAKYGDTVKTTEPDAKDKEKYAKVDFSAGNLGTIADDATKTYWVVKEAEVTLTPPTVTANEGWKVNAEKPWDPAVATKYTKDTIHLAQYDYDGASVVPQKPGDEKPNVPDNFVKVEFKKGEHGVISSEENFIYWVDPTKEVKITAPAVIADTNYKHDGWKNGDAVVDLTKANKFETATDLVAQYKSTVVTEDPKDENYVTVEFNAKDHGTLEGTAKFWVYKNEKVSITAPTVTGKDGYTFDKWDPAVKDSYAEATVHNATYTTNNNVSDTEVEGYNKVTFKAGEHGTVTEKSVWVKPDTLVDLNNKAPKVTPEKGYSHIGWKPGLVGKFENNTDIVAQYTEEKTPEPIVTARNIGTEGPDGKRVPATKTTVEIETVPKAKVTIEYTDKDGQPQKIENLTAGEDGKLTQEITPKLDKDTPVKVTVQDGEKQPTEKTVKVFDDLDGDKIPDTQAGKTERPAALASNIGKEPKFTTITGEAEKGATVTAKVGKEVVGTATADSTTGKYTIQAKQNNAPIKEGVKIDVTATLAPKAESEKQTVVVFKDTDGTGQPDSAKDFDVKKAKEMQVVASPDKMVYSDGDKLNLDGLKVLVTDVNGNQKIFTYKHDANTEFTKAGLSVDLKQETVLSSKDYNAQTAKDGHNGRKLVVTLDTTGNTQVTEAITGQTPTALTVNKNQSAQPTDVVAANQDDATVTKVKGKATKDAEIKITDANGQSLLPEGKTIKADANGDFTADLNKLLNPGTKVFVTATEPGKSESPKAETTVIRDKDGNWKPDTGAKLSTPVIDPIREKDEKVVVAAPKADDKIQTIEVSDQKGNKVTLTKNPTDTKGKTWKVEGSNPEVKVTENNEGKLEIPVKDKLPLNDRDQIKVTFKDGEKPANEAFDKAPVQKASQTPKVDPVYTGDKNVKIVDPTVADPTAKTIKVKVGKNDTRTIQKQDDGTWKDVNDPNAKIEVKDGKVVVNLDPSAKKDDVIKVSTINDSKKESQAAEVRVVDKEKSTTPEVKPVSTNDTKITGKAGPNADVVITITPKDGGTPKEINAKADKEGNFSVPADGLKDGDTIVAKATEKDKAPAESAPVTVGVDKSKLIKAIDDGDKKLEGKDPKDYTPADKKLKEAIEEGKKVKDNPNASQNDVNEKTKAIEDAIKEKEETDKALKELEEAKKALDKTIKDAKDDKKPQEEIAKGQKSSKDAGTVIDNKGKDKDGKDMTSNQIKELVEKTKEADRLLKLPVIQVRIDTAVNGGNTIVLTTNPGRCKVTVIITRSDFSEETYDLETGADGTGSILLEKALSLDDNILVQATRITKDRPVPDYLDNYTSTGV